MAFVGIDGGGGAGRSTLAAALAEARDDVRVLRLDDFFLSTVGGPESVDVARLRREALEPLATGRPARFRRFEGWGEHLAEKHVVEPRRVVVVEGVFALQPDLRGLYDVTAWVEAAEAAHARTVAAVDLVVLG